MKLADYLLQSIEKLKLSSIDNPSLDARLLFCHALHIDRAELLSQSERLLSPEETATIDALIARRAAHESVARIIGHREFWGLDFSLNEATLEPRPDSETLIEATLKIIRAAGTTPLRPLGGKGEIELSQQEPPENGVRWDNRPFRILDLGTGTGCLLLSLLHEFPAAIGMGIDINPRAAEQATANARSLNLSNRATFRVGNWLENITGKFDVIISNPPYIPHFYIQHLMPEVRDHDPMLALDGGNDGLGPYRHLIPKLHNFLNPQGIICFEVGVTQAPQVVDLLAQSGFTNIKTHKDLGGIERCVTAATPNAE